MSCSVKSCKNRQVKKASGVSFHHFPSDESLRNLWIHLIGRNEDRNWTWHPGRYICSEHFEEEDMNRVNVRPYIQKGAIPSLKLSEESNDEITTKNNSNKTIREDAAVNFINLSIESDHGLYAKPKIKTKSSDIEENLDIESALEGPSNTSTDLLDENNSAAVSVQTFDLQQPVKPEQETGENRQEIYQVQFVTYEDLNVMCRVCLEPGDLKPLINPEYLDCLKLIAPFDVNYENRLPGNVCNKCFVELGATWNFVKKYRESVETLRPIMEEFEKMGVFEEENRKASILEIANEENSDETFLLRIEDSESEETEDTKLTAVNEENLWIVEELPKQVNVAIEGLEGESSFESFPIILENQLQKVDNDPIESAKTKQFVCSSCGEIATNLITHYKQNKACIPKHLKCKICNKLFQNNSKLQYHMKVHEKGKSFECHLCPTKFKFMQNLRRHLLTVHLHKKRYKCPQCDKVYTTALVRNDHMNIHTGAKPFVCNYCDESFNNRPARYKHMKKVHLCPDAVASSYPGEPLVCGTCDRVCASKNSLKNHLLTHSDRKDYLCVTCGKRFRTSGALHVHSAVHTKERRFSCPFCAKTFLFDSAVKAHIKIHTGERPYKCNLCSRSFSQKPHLKTHVLTHTGEKSNVCTSCGKAFALKGNLVVHMRTHTGETPYSCHVCAKGFHDSSSRKKHVRTYHGLGEVARIPARYQF